MPPRSLSPRLALGLCVFACALGVALSFAQARHAGGERHDPRALAMLSIVEGSDYTNLGDPMPALQAARKLHEDRRARIYDDQHVESSFLYPPVAALFYAPLAAEPLSSARETLIVVDHLLWLASGLVLLALLRGGGPLAWREVTGGLLALAVWYPLLRALALNQATLFVTLVIGLAWVALEHGMELVCGVLFALAVAFKPHLALALPILWWHARRAVVAAALAIVALFALSVFYAGLANHVDYVTKLLPSLARGYACPEEQSFHGLFNRLVGSGDYGSFTAAPASRLSSTLATFASAVSYATVIYVAWRARGTAMVASLVFGLAWLAATLASPLAWEHHYAPAIFLFAVVYRTQVSGAAPRVLFVPVAAAFVLMASYFDVRALSGAGPRLLASYVLAGAMLLGASTVALVLSGRRLREGAGVRDS